VLNITSMINRIKSHPRYPEVGMIVCHTGVVRGTSRNGRPVSALEVKVDGDRLKEVIAGYKQKPGIVDIMVEANQGTLNVGDDIMAVVVAGDIRENVFPVLQEVVDTIKREVVRKREHFV
jgi:molybdopterin synthase catalytic subunit